jgi:glucans biosynthesis protein
MTQIAIAPLTSMFFHGENSTQRYGDYRPEVHDSDGLLVQQADQNWLWQPLAEVPYFNVGAIPSKQLKGFGLMQRDRDFNNYQDLEAWYHTRPSVWVEPLEEWGSGQVKLMRLHTESDTTDNIVAFWQSDAGMQFKRLHYRLSWRSTDPETHKLGKVVATRVTNKAVDSMPGHTNRIRFIIDFNQLPALKEPPTAIITINGKAQAKPAVVQENPYIKGWRVIAVVFPDSCAEPINLSVQLTNGGNPLTETWSYPVPQDLCIAP